jgi:cytochrome P450
VIIVLNLLTKTFTGLLLSNGNKWHQRRKIITPTFHFQILEQFTEIMDTQANVFVSSLKKYEGQHIDFFPLISLYTLDVICGNEKKNENKFAG